MNLKKKSFALLVAFTLMACSNSPDIDPAQSTANRQMSIYPNPVSDVVSFGIYVGTPFSLSVFDLDGKIMVTRSGMTDTTYSINVHDKPAGTYHVVLHTGGNEIKQKFIKL